ncbi:MAG: F0F1 ATP synthase subunit delta [Nevskiales bacterium]
MADLSTLARPYAKAMFELARDSRQLKEWSAQLMALAQAVADPQLGRLIGHPALDRSQLADVFGQVLTKALNNEGRALLKLLVENGRLKSAGFIAHQYEALRAEAESRVNVEVTSAAPVEPAQQNALAAAIKKRLSRDVAIEWKTDETLVAGAVIRAGDLVIDGSVRGELERLNTALTR